ncbi:integrase [Alphaproteobacteria bacterium]|nr:integrase [Alphaproteobacteria bacterium]
MKTYKDGKNNGSNVTLVRCAIYTRKSSEEGLEQEFNSLDAQRIAAENYIRSQQGKGWIILPQHYDDGGFSGGNMNRPALTELLKDIEYGRVDCVVTYKLDRLSRSLLDFASIMNTFDSNNVMFDTVTESFSSASSSGRLMLNMLLSFAQYERELTGERIRDKFAESKKKGMWMGGYPILGYDIKERKLLINEEEAVVIKLIYERFIETESCTLIADELNRKGCRSKPRPQDKGKNKGEKLYDPKAIRRILENPYYKGYVTHKGELYKGQHEAIIAEETWSKVQEIFSKNKSTKHQKKSSPYPLKGLLKCGTCGATMSPTACNNHGLKYRYYTCNNHIRFKRCNSAVKNVPADSIESRVIEEVLQKLKSPEVMLKIQELAKENTVDEKQLQTSLQNLSETWTYLYPQEQMRIMKLLVDFIEIKEDSLNIQMNMDGFNTLLLGLGE